MKLRVSCSTSPSARSVLTTRSDSNFTSFDNDFTSSGSNLTPPWKAASREEDASLASGLIPFTDLRSVYGISFRGLRFRFTSVLLNRTVDGLLDRARSTNAGHSCCIYCAPASGASNPCTRMRTRNPSGLACHQAAPGRRKRISCPVEVASGMGSTLRACSGIPAATKTALVDRAVSGLPVTIKTVVLSNTWLFPPPRAPVPRVVLRDRWFGASPKLVRG
mmetsp:Transcript_22264/g.37224  ORF Transcript_22264/g.37224 Transcript_22264/m.37224 type:complete len:220 (-) Transcript_22264:816-1475(-)